MIYDTLSTYNYLVYERVDSIFMLQFWFKIYFYFLFLFKHDIEFIHGRLIGINVKCDVRTSCHDTTHFQQPPTNEPTSICMFACLSAF